MTRILACCNFEDAPRSFLDSEFSVVSLDFTGLSFSDDLKVLANKKSKLLLDCTKVTSIEQMNSWLEITPIDLKRIFWLGNEKLLLEIRKRFPEAAIWLPWNRLEMPTEDVVHSLRPEFIYLDYSLVNASNLKEVHDLGIQVATSSMDDPFTMRWAIALGVDSISTPWVDELHKVMMARPVMDHGRPQKMEFTAIDIDQAMKVARSLGKWAIHVASTLEPGKIQHKKSAADIVTEIDVLVEVHVREVISANFIGHNFVGEELGGEFQPDVPTWYLDPIDGTTNFANHLPWTSFSLALAHNRNPLVGVVIDPWRNSLLEAQAGRGAKLNGELIRIEDQSGIDSPLSSRIVSTELDAYLPWPGMIELLDGLASQFCTMRIMGSGTLTMAGVALKRGVGAVVGRFSAIDHLASLLIVHEAGGVVWDENGKENLFPQSGGVLTSTQAAAQPLYDLWMKAIGKN